MTTTSPSVERRVALVTGAGQGIGAAISRTLAAEGHHVFVNDIVGERAEKVADEIRIAGGQADALVADVTRSEAVNGMFDHIESVAGMATTLVNNAGGGGNAAIRDVNDEYWEHVLDADLNSVLYCTRRALGPMRETHRGTVVNIASRAWLGWWGQAAYASAKAGVIGMTRSLAVEMSSRNIRINAIAPGLIDTPMLRNRSQEALDRLLKSVPMARLGTPEDIANAVAFLVSERARAITGQVLYVCGGKSVYAYPDWPNR